MKRAIPPDELPYVVMTDNQIEYQFPQMMVIDSDVLDTAVRVNLILACGFGRILLEYKPSNRMYAHYAPECMVDVERFNIDKRMWRAVDVRDIEYLTSQYDMIEVNCVGWDVEYFEICLRNRCLIVPRQPVRYDAPNRRWLEEVNRHAFGFSPSLTPPAALFETFGHTVFNGRRCIYTRKCVDRTITLRSVEEVICAPLFEHRR